MLKLYCQLEHQKNIAARSIKSAAIVDVYLMSSSFLMDSSQRLKQLLNEDLASLGAYYREICALQGSGVLVVNYYPGGEVAQMSAKYLKPNQIGRLARQMGLPTLQVEFERHNQQDQMVVALVTAETKGVVTVELPPLELQTAPVNTSETQGETSTAPSSKRKTASKTTKRKSPAKSTKQHDEENQPQTETLEPQSQVASEPTAEAQTVTQPTVESDTTARAIAQSETTSKPAAKRKSSSKTPARRKSPAKSTKKNPVQEEPQSGAASQR